MGQVSKKIRKTEDGFSHWCPGCETMHHIVTSGRFKWDFNGNYDYPTVNPSIKIRYDGKDADSYRPDGNRAPSRVCHYFLQDGLIKYCPDCTHSYRSQTIALPDLPWIYQDPIKKSFFLSGVKVSGRTRSVCATSLAFVPCPVSSGASDSLNNQGDYQNVYA